MAIMSDERPPNDEMYETIKASANLFKIVLPEENYDFNGNNINFGVHGNIHEKLDE